MKYCSIVAVIALATLETCWNQSRIVHVVIANIKHLSLKTFLYLGACCYFGVFLISPNYSTLSLNYFRFKL